MSFIGVEVEPYSDLDLVTAEEAAAHVNVSRSLVYYWRAKGLLRPVVRYHGSWLYRRIDVAELDEQQRAKPLSSRYDLEPAGA